MSSDYCKPHLLLTVHSVGLVVSRQKHATMMSEEDWRDDEELIEASGCHWRELPQVPL